jgi:phage shock protein C
VLGGVITGLGRRMGIEPWPARLLFVLVLMLIPGSQILIYPILWILMPSEQPVPVSTGPGATVTAATGPAGPYPPAA